MTKISDAQLTENGLTEMAAGRILLIACGALAREILNLKKANGLGSYGSDLFTCQAAPLPRKDH